MMGYRKNDTLLRCAELYARRKIQKKTYEHNKVFFCAGNYHIRFLFLPHSISNNQNFLNPFLLFLKILTMGLLQNCGHV